MTCAIIPSLCKPASATRTYIVDLSLYAEVLAGETLSLPAFSATPAGLTFGVPAVLAANTNGVPAGQAVEVAIAGGTAGTTYRVLASAATSGGATLVQPFDLTAE